MLLNFGTAIVLLKLLHTVFKKLSTKDYILMGMLFSLCCSCVTLVLYFITQIYNSSFRFEDGYIPEPDTTETDYELGPYSCYEYVVTGLPSAFLFVAVILNINKWMYFRWRILSLSVQK
jgi:hypothetical protein